MFYAAVQLSTREGHRTPSPDDPDSAWSAPWGGEVLAVGSSFEAFAIVGESDDRAYKGTNN